MQTVSFLTVYIYFITSIDSELDLDKQELQQEVSDEKDEDLEI